MKICLSLAANNIVAVREIFRRIPKNVDLVEVRLDRITDPALEALLRNPRPTVIITNRSVSDGGDFEGTIEEQYEILSRACRLGADYVDVEMRWGAAFYKKIRKQFPLVKLILSHHDFEQTPKNLTALYRSMQRLKPDIVKIATMATSISDNARMFAMMEEARNDKQPVIGLCMGEFGQLSRILGVLHGAYLTYGSFNPNSFTAPGQISADVLTNLFRVHILKKKTKIFGLVGNPVSHSQGIQYHNDIFRRKKLDAVYLNFLSECFESFSANFMDLVSGVSVTMPFKQEAASYITTWGDDCNDLGVVNTIIKRGNELVGYNTDLTAIRQLLRKRKHLGGKHAIILGTGGLARTMAYAAIREGARVTIAGRSGTKAAALANALGCAWATIDEVPSLPCDLLMNGTPIGMHPGNDSELIPNNYFKKKMLVLEAVYAPEMTTFVKRAEAAGCMVIKGGEIFNRQAALQSKLFIGTLS